MVGSGDERKQRKDIVSTNKELERHEKTCYKLKCHCLERIISLHALISISIIHWAQLIFTRHGRDSETSSIEIHNLLLEALGNL